jgi:hypothetical protein
MEFALRSMREFYTAWGKPEEAAKWKSVPYPFASAK